MIKRCAPLALALVLSLYGAQFVTRPQPVQPAGRLAGRPCGAVARRCATNNPAGPSPALPGPAVVDGAYVQAQLARLVTRDQHREAGQDTGLPPAQNGHDEFAADWLAALRGDLAGLPLRVTRQQFPLPGFKGRPPKTPGTNLIVTLPGTTHPRDWVLLVAHYDGTPITTQSAYDDGSGCAILLGVARAMAPLWRRHRPARTVAFILFDGEEQGLIGSFYDAAVYRNTASYHIVALYNEEQNGVGYPIRPFGLASNPLLPEHVMVTPRRHGSRFASPVPPALRPEIRRFSAALARARASAFAVLHRTYPRLAYHTTAGAPTSMAVFTPADEKLVPIGDDVVGASDEAPFERLGLPTATFVGNYDRYERRHEPWSYPFDSPYDTMALLERTASGATAPSPALAAALALPGQLTVQMLQTSAWGSE